MKRLLGGVVRALARGFATTAGLRRAGRWSAEVGHASADVHSTVRDDRDYRFSSASPLLLWRARTIFEKEPETIAWIRGFAAADVFFDVGANVGTYSIYAAGRCGRVLAFEPESANFAVLNRNIRLNGLDGVVTAYPIALSDEVRLDTLRLNSSEPGAALHVFGSNVDFKAEEFAPTAMQGAISLPLDDLVFRFGLPCPTKLKIDVDGLEPQVLRGAQRLLADRRLNWILLEINESLPAEAAMANTLLEAGFRVSAKGEPVRLPGGKAVMVNYVFARD